MTTPTVPPRDQAGHKGTFGTVCVIGGRAAPPRVMIGGPAFSAAAALRSGAGLAVLAVPAPIMSAALVITPGATGLALPVDPSGHLVASETARLLDETGHDFDCLAVGPGWGTGVPQQQILVRLLARADAPIVVDADGLNALATLADFAGDLGGPTVLTPHPGEFRRLAKGLELHVDPETPEHRSEAAEQLARRLGCIVALKGPRTVVTDGHTTYVNETGNAALATAGTGDVLTGVIAGFIAQFYGKTLSLIECVRSAVEVHGQAGDRWAAEHGEAGLDARELIDLLPDTIAACRRCDR